MPVYVALPFMRTPDTVLQPKGYQANRSLLTELIQGMRYDLDLEKVK